MADFLKDSQIMSAIEDMIDNADDFLWLLSPYIKLHDRIKDRLRLKKELYHLDLVVVFGKNEEDASKSLSKEDFEFLKEFPNITIGYEKRLHAKYYASESCAIITSMNLHEFSQNNNIEMGIKLKSKKLLLQFTSSDLENDSYNYFLDVLENCSIIFKKEAKFKSTAFGLMETYTHSEVITDESETFFKKKEEFTGKKYYQTKPKSETIQATSTQGYCIRTGKQIPFDLKRPMCYEAYQSWAQFKNMDYAEKFCHKTGKSSNGKTSMRNPVLK